MRKRILSFVLVLVMVCAMSISVFAGSAYDSGNTSGGSQGTLFASASLSAYTEHATAETSCDIVGVIYKTSVKLHFIDGNFIEDRGGDYVTLWKSSDLDVPNTSHATSSHEVRGGTTYGNWNTSLRANVW